MARESMRRRAERRWGKPERLADMIGGSSWEPPAWCRPVMDRSKPHADLWRELRADLTKKVGEAHLVVADNVSDYYFEHPKDEWIYKTDFPCVTPPFQTLFVEAGKPPIVVSARGRHRPAAWVPFRYGFLFESLGANEVIADSKTHFDRYIVFLKQQVDSLAPFVDMESIRAASKLGSYEAAMATLGESEQLYVNSVLGIERYGKNPDAAAEGFKSIGLDRHVRATLVIASDNGVVCGPLVDWTILLGSSGAILVDPSPTVFLGGIEPDPAMTREIRDALATFLPPALLALSFMNCRNVALTPVDPDPALNRVRLKAGLKPFLRYHTINIEPMKTVLRTEGDIEVNGLKKALHIVRGYFAHYTEDKPLFGRPGLSGAFWVPSHARGSFKQGVVVSDYRVNTPHPESP